MIIDKFTPFKGEHCETTMLGNLLNYRGMLLTEPMLFGIGEGLSYIYWDSKKMEYPYIGGRCKQDVLTANISKNLKIRIKTKETSSKRKAWEIVKNKIDLGIPVGLKLDCFYLDYFKNKFHFAAHYITMYGYDDKWGYVVDTNQQGKQMKASLDNIAEGRNAKGFMASKNKVVWIDEIDKQVNLREVILSSIRNNAKEYLNPQIKNLSFKGIEKTAESILKWLKRPELTSEKIILTGTLMEKGGTGGALFRNLYRDFLKESNDIYPDLCLYEGYLAFKQIALMWEQVSNLICHGGKNMDEKPLIEASKVLIDIAQFEKEAIEKLLKIE